MLQDVCINPYHYKRVESPVLPPVLVPRYSDPLPPGGGPGPIQNPGMMPFQGMDDTGIPTNVSYSQHGFSQPPMINTGGGPGGGGMGPMSSPSGVSGPTSPGMSSGGIPSPHSASQVSQFDCQSFAPMIHIF